MDKKLWGFISVSVDGNTLKATWDGTEEVQVYKRNTEGLTFIGTLHAHASATNQTTLTGTMNIAPNPATDYLDFYYIQAEMDYMGQDGSLATIGRQYDYCDEQSKAPGAYSVGGTNIILTDEMALHFMGKKQAIVKFILQDKDGNAINPTTLTVSGSGEKLLAYYDRITEDTSYEDLVFNSLPGNTNVVYAALRLDTCTLPLLAQTEGVTNIDM